MAIKAQEEAAPDTRSVSRLQGEAQRLKKARRQARATARDERRRNPAVANAKKREARVLETKIAEVHRTIRKRQKNAQA